MSAATIFYGQFADIPTPGRIALLASRLVHALRGNVMTAAKQHDPAMTERQRWFVALDFGVADTEAVLPTPPAESAHDVLP